MHEQRKDHIWGIPITLIVSLLVYIGIGLWWGSNITAAVNYESKTREDCMNQIEKRIERIESKIDKILEKVLRKQ